MSIPITHMASPYRDGNETRKRFYDLLHWKWPPFPDVQLIAITIHELDKRHWHLRLKDFHDRDKIDLVLFKMADSPEFKRHRMESKDAGRPYNVTLDDMLDRMKKIIGEYLFEKNMAGD